MKEQIPSKDDQIEALLHAKEYDLTMEYAGRDKNGRPQYSKVFSVTRKDIEKYVKDHYQLSELPFVYMSEKLEDGIYIIPYSGGYKVYNQERGIHFGETILETYDDVLKWYIEYTLRTSGTGLKWE